MSGTAISTASRLLLAAAIAAGACRAADNAGADYLPLKPGTHWVYRWSPRPSTMVDVTVAGTRTFGGNSFTVLKGFPEGDLFVRIDNAGVARLWNAAKSVEEVWAALSSPVGTRFDAALDTCSLGGTVKARGTRYSGPAGTFDDTVTISYGTRCCDAGVIEDVFAAGVGLVRRTTMTIAGHRVMELTTRAPAGNPGASR
jgi:hypothetical protein